MSFRRRVIRVLDSTLPKLYGLFNFDGVTVDSSAVISPVTQFARVLGDVNVRTTDAIKIRYMRVRGDFESVDSSNAYRILVIQWNSDDLVLKPTIADIIQDPSTLAGLMFGMRKIDSTMEFRVLYDKVFHAKPGSTAVLGSATTNFITPFEFMISGKKFDIVQYEEASTFGSNHVYLIMYSDSNIGTPSPIVRAQSTVSFINA